MMILDRSGLAERRSPPVHRRGLRWFAGAVMLSSACVRSAPQTAPTLDAPFVFHAQTAADTLLEGTFDGSAVVRDGWIAVAVKPTLTFPPGPTERWRSVTIRAFVATDYDRGRWRAPVASTPVNVWQYLVFPRASAGQGRTTTVFKDTLRFQVPIPKGATLGTARLGFEVEWVTLYKDYGQTEQNYAFSGPINPP